MREKELGKIKMLKKRLAYVGCAVLLVVTMLATIGPEANASSSLPMVDGSYLTHESEAIGYINQLTRGEDLLTGYSKMVRLGPGAIYAGGTTMAAQDVPRVQISVLIERIKNEGDNWAAVTGWHAEELNAPRVATSKRIEVDGDYYYRTMCIHSAGQDMSDSFTNGVYVEKPSL